MVDIDLLQDVALLADLTDDEMARVAASAVTARYLRGDLVFAEADPPDRLCVVAAGRIAIAKRSVDGRESMVALMERGDVFGEMGLFDGGVRSAEARALEPSELVELPYAPLKAVYEARPDLLWGVVRLLAGRLRNLPIPDALARAARAAAITVSRPGAAPSIPHFYEIK